MLQRNVQREELRKSGKVVWSFFGDDEVVVVVALVGALEFGVTGGTFCVRREKWEAPTQRAKGTLKDECQQLLITRQFNNTVIDLCPAIPRVEYQVTRCSL